MTLLGYRTKKTKNIWFLTPKLLWPIFCLFLKFRQAILVRILETSCTNRPLHNEHENVICAKKSFIEKKLKAFFGQKMKLGQL